MDSSRVSRKKDRLRGVLDLISKKAGLRYVVDGDCGETSGLYAVLRGVPSRLVDGQIAWKSMQDLGVGSGLRCEEGGCIGMGYLSEQLHTVSETCSLCPKVASWAATLTCLRLVEKGD